MTIRKGLVLQPDAAGATITPDAIFQALGRILAQDGFHQTPKVPGWIMWWRTHPTTGQIQTIVYTHYHQPDKPGQVALCAENWLPGDKR